MNVLGLTSAFSGFHDSSAVWVRDGRIQLALSEERFSRIKHDRNFPAKCIEEIIKQSGLQSLKDFDAIGIAWKPYNAFSGFFARSLRDVPATFAYNAVAQPAGIGGYIWKNFLNFKVFPPKSLLQQHGVDPARIHYLPHHLCHGASAFRTSGYDEAISVNVDCFGPDDEGNLWSGAAYVCRDNQMDLIGYIPPFASIGLFYSAVSVCLGFKFGDGEGKTMGLAAFGDPAVCYEGLREMAPFFRDGKWHGHESWSDFRLIDAPSVLFGTRWGAHLRDLIVRHGRENTAAAVQRILEEELGHYCDHLIQRHKIRSLVLAGGTFLNVKFNRMLLEHPDVDRVYVHPFASDGGTAAGAALEMSARLSGQRVNYEMPHAYLGSSFTDDEIAAELAEFGAQIRFTKQDSISKTAAKMIADGSIIGWFQGAAEWGPRALGNRSVLGDPRNDGTKERLNKHLKSRDWFMPFAPSILAENMGDFFYTSEYTPFMTFAFPIREDKKSVVPAAMHHDGTARPHAVKRAANERYYDLISAFRDITGIPMVLNTSFNRHGLPLINTPREAVEHLLWGCVDVLCVGSYLVERGGAVAAVDSFTENALRDAYVEETAFESAFNTSLPPVA